MIPKLDLFHQLFYRSPEGFVAVLFYTERFPEANVYTPQGEWCGCSGATNEWTLQADIRHIVKTRINYEQGKISAIHEAAN